jgi:phosphoglycolate phosphatase
VTTGRSLLFHLTTEMLPQRVSSMRVILFDIDGTLVKKRSTEADERERFRRAVYDEVGRSPPIEPWRYDGMVDPQICRLLLIDVGLSENAADERLQRVIDRVERIYVATEKRPVLNDGVGKLLKILSASSRHKLGVITGNLSVVAEEKLRLTGTRAYFAETFYSDGYFERAELARAAIRTCVGKYRLRGEEFVTIVGDTPRDVEAAKSNGAKAIAVASGFFSEGELAAAGADAVFHDLSPRADLLKAFEMAHIP